MSKSQNKTLMKNTFKFILALIVSLGLGAGIKADPIKPQAKDSIIINFDDDTRIVIFVKGKADLEKLKNYDLNAMIRDISVSIDSSSNVNYLKLEDNQGDKYLKDTTYIERTVGDDYDEGVEESRITNEGDNKAKVRLGNYRFEVDMDDVDDIDEAFDDIDEDGFKVTTTNEEERARKTHQEFNVEIGVNNFLEGSDFPSGSANYSVKPFGSWYVGLSSIRRTHVGKGPLFIEWGGTLHWYNFKMDNPDIQILKTENGTEFLEPAAGVSGIKSKLTASYLSVSLVPVLDFSHGTRKVKRYEASGISISKYKKQGVRIGVGGYAGYRLGSHTKYRFKQDGDKDRDKSRGNFNLNNFRYGVRGQIGYKGMDLFINYDINELFNSGKGPKLNAVSFGFIL